MALKPNGEVYDLRGQKVSFGNNVRLLVCHLIVQGLSYTQVIHLLEVLHGLNISSGEIALMIKTKHQSWLASYQKLRAKIRASPCLHIDETPWAIQALGGSGYAWVMSAPNQPDVYFELAPSRGVKIAQKMLGSFKGVRISDNYGAYRSVSGKQQLCSELIYLETSETLDTMLI
ncbi:MAG: transposase [Candidatus Saccharibacteria bacterium]|nr:transposase [Candidatus Saccharibacteria bacterium]